MRKAACTWLSRRLQFLRGPDSENSMVMNWEKLLNANRPRKTTIKSDHRAEFERDFDRAVFSTPVKRLQDKVQVFPSSRMTRFAPV